MNFCRSFVFIKRNADLLVKDSYIKPRLDCGVISRLLKGNSAEYMDSRPVRYARPFACPAKCNEKQHINDKGHSTAGDI